MVYLVLPCGSSFGWGLCGKYLVKELTGMTTVRYVNPDFDPNDLDDELAGRVISDARVAPEEMSRILSGTIGRIDPPVLHAITDHQLKPWSVELRGSINAGYTFFEVDRLPQEAVDNGRKNFDIIVTGSTWCENVLRSHGLTNVQTIIQGIDPQLFNPARSVKELFQDRFVVFSGGKFELRKGQDIVIRAFKVLQDRHPDVMLVNAWYNPWPFSMQTMSGSPYIRCNIGESDYLSNINAILVENGIDLKRVVTVMPHPNAQMAKIYKNTDIGLFPNRCEGGTNLVLMEYMACGKPVIASFSSGHQDILNAENSIRIQRMRQMRIQSGGVVHGLWDDPDLDEVIAHLEAAYQNRGPLQGIAARAAQDLSQLTWQHTASSFYRLLLHNTP